MSAELPHIRCGCGFEVVGADEAANVQAFQLHECSTNESTPWYAGLFTDEGWMIVFIVGMVALAIVQALAG
jgi:hypothetical protein